MKIHSLRRLPDTSTWEWRTIESNKGTYYTNAIGSGMFFRSDDGKYVEKLLPYERFKVCKTPSGTRRKLNKIFEHCEADPTPDNRFKDLCFTPLYSTLLKSKK